MVIPILTIIAVFSFRSTLRQKGYDAPRLWLFPVLVGGGTYFADWMVGFAIGVVARTRNSALLQMLPYLIGLFAILVWYSIISRAWTQIKALPQR